MNSACSHSVCQTEFGHLFLCFCWVFLFPLILWRKCPTASTGRRQIRLSQSEWPNTFELSHGSLQGTGWYCIGILSCHSHHLLVKCPIFPISAADSYFPRILEASRDPGLSFESEKSWFKAAKLSRGVQECHTTASVEHQLLSFDQISADI